MLKKIIFTLVILVYLNGCTIIPGMHMNPFFNTSSVEMPTTEQNKAILKELEIQNITAQLIIDLEKDFNN